MATIDQLDGVTTGMGAFVWMWQLKLAMKASGDLYAFDAAVQGDITDEIRIIWDSGGKTAYGDTLSAAIKTALSKTDLQMLALYQAAAAEVL